MRDHAGPRPGEARPMTWRLAYFTLRPEMVRPRQPIRRGRKQNRDAAFLSAEGVWWQGPSAAATRARCSSCAKLRCRRREAPAGEARSNSGGRFCGRLLQAHRPREARSDRRERPLRGRRRHCGLLSQAPRDRSEYATAFRELEDVVIGEPSLKHAVEEFGIAAELALSSPRREEATGKFQEASLRLENAVKDAR